MSTFGAVHVVCNNAGVVVSGRVEELTDDEWRWVLDVDLWGAIHGVRVFLPLLEQAGEGHILSTASTSGLVAPPFIAPYSVSKAGVVMLMEAVRRELEARQSPIGAGVLVPGPVKTALVSSPRRAARGGAALGHARGAGVRGALGRLPRGDRQAARGGRRARRRGIRAGRFWILTHPEWGDVLRRRVEAMTTTGLPTDRPGL